MKQLYKLYPTLFVLASLVPMQAGAQNQLNEILSNIGGTINVVISFLFVLATIIFLWGVIKYIAKGSEEKEQKAARGLMLYGIIGLAVMASVWGIVNILIQYFLSGNIGKIPDEPGEF
ncbi:MAG: hypothetical protein HYT37_03955 [Candidatus Sungbacteria bacterium]|nr:hypothetical protein [Candidatus Sungbacteria bacterium]